MDSFGPKIVVVLGLILASVCGAEDTQDLSQYVREMVERINRRYDDFYRYHREMEERQARLQEGRGERKRAQKAYYDQLERARVEYVKNKKPKHSDEPLRLAWEHEQLERKKKIEMLRQRHVKARDQVDQYLLKGRKIPELKEYDLEGY